MTSSEEYIIRLLQTIESLDSTMKSMREEIRFLRDELGRLREKDTEHDIERKRLMKLLEAKGRGHQEDGRSNRSAYHGVG